MHARERVDTGVDTQEGGLRAGRGDARVTGLDVNGTAVALVRVGHPRVVSLAQGMAMRTVDLKRGIANRDLVRSPGDDRPGQGHQRKQNRDKLATEVRSPGEPDSPGQAHGRKLKRSPIKAEPAIVQIKLGRRGRGAETSSAFAGHSHPLRRCRGDEKGERKGG